MPSKVLAKVIRGETIESVHRGHLVVIDGNGETVAAVGDPKAVTYFRSASKPFQAIPLLTSGAADAFGFSGEEIALACASHSGEARHVRLAALMLERIGLNEAHLHCGTHMPFYEKEAERMLRAGEFATQLHNNCSGKHAGMLAFAKHTDAFIGNYEEAENPVQKAILEVVSRFTGVPADKIKTGIDGCCAPNFAVSISAMAKSFAALVNPHIFEQRLRDACGRIVSAMVTFPELIGGTERLDTMLMQAAPGVIISKVGADGVWLCGVLSSEKFPAGLGIALKIEDGNDHRARPVVAVEILKQLGILSSEDLPELSPTAIKNRRGDVVGKVVSIIEIG
ncbi:MAG TPA: asparaginase [Pyrinomonadaceae bacterium]|nr:asparaginase [Pyrinomonadaceae bacterium]